MTSSDGTSSDTQRSVYLPADQWFELRFGGPKWLMGTHEGPAAITITGVDLNSLPVFVRAGSIVLTGPVLQYTDQQPGGSLQPLVFAGADAEFTLWEDDGSTLAYAAGSSSAVRTTVFTWSDAARTLSWQVTSDVAVAAAYVNVQPTLVTPQGQTTAAVAVLGAAGSIKF